MGMRKSFWCLLIGLLAGSMLPARGQRQEMLLNDNWQFRFSHQVEKGSARRVDLPHTWNARDALAGKLDYKRGIGNYEKRLWVKEEWRGKRLFLRFEGANSVADVFINGCHIGQHRGGYGAFVFEITDKVDYGAENALLVRVNNAETLEVMPLVGDFNFYGGIYRDVHLIVTEPLCISLTDYASSGVRLVQDSVSRSYASGRAVVRLSNGTGKERHALLRLRLLGGLRDELSRHLSGRIRLIFQPAEEEGEGAPGMVAAGAVDGVRALFGLHLSMQASRSGDLVCGTDKFLATTNFEVFFTGQSAHAGLAPHEGRNALLAACTAVTNLLAIARHGQGASRINVGEMHVNETPNIIPAKAWLRGETRGENGDINGYMLAEARRVVDGAARMHGCRSRFLCQSHCPGAMSSPELVDLVERTARDMGSFREVRRKADFWASEDFGWFMNKVQEDGGLAAYLQLGADRPDGHHTSHFTFDESVLPRGLELLARLAVAALARRPD